MEINRKYSRFAKTIRIGGQRFGGRLLFNLESALTGIIAKMKEHGKTNANFGNAASNYKEKWRTVLLYFELPASSAGTERVYSLASIVQNRHYRLDAENTENELMIKVNRKVLMSKFE